jgi:class 3 adenylate cyclase
MSTGFSARFCRKCLYSSISFEDMVRFAKMAYPGYDIYKSSGYPKGTPISSQDAANRIVTDMLQDGYYIDFIETLIRVDNSGYMGRRYAFRGLDDVISDVIQAGYSYDNETKQFFEDQSQQITRNWGRLIEGDERQMAVLRLDVVGNTILVKENPKSLIDKAYGDLRKIVSDAVVSRLGRLWIWEGDGSLCAFMLGNYSRMAIFAGMDILNEMFLYNKMKNPLNSIIKLRISVHSGDFLYSENDIKCLKNDIVLKATTLESKAAIPNSLVISESLAVSQDQSLLNIFSDVKAVSSDKYRIYQVNQEGAS